MTQNLTPIHKLAENLDVLTQKSKTLTLTRCQYNLTPKEREFSLQEVWDFLHTGNYIPDEEKLNFSSSTEMNQVGKREMMQTEIILDFQDTKFSQHTYEMCYFLVKYLQSRWFFVSNVGCDLSELVGVCDEITQSGGLTRLSDNFISHIATVLEDYKQHKNFHYFLEDICGRIDKFQQKIDTVAHQKTAHNEQVNALINNQEIEADARKLIQELIDLLDTGSEAEIVEYFEKLVNNSKTLIKSKQGIVKNLLDFPSPKISRKFKSYVNETLSTQRDLKKPFGFIKAESNKSSNYLSYLAQKNKTNFLATKTGIVFEFKKLLQSTIRGKKVKFSDIKVMSDEHKNFFGRPLIWVETYQTEYYSGCAKYMIDVENNCFLQLEGCFVKDVGDEMFEFEGKEYIQIKDETSNQAYFDKDLQPLRIDDKAVLEIEKKEIFWKKCHRIVMQYREEFYLDENNKKIKINGKELKWVYADESKEFHGKQFQKICLEDVWDCYIDKNWKLLIKKKEIIENIYNKTCEFFGKKYQLVESAIMGHHWVDKNDEILKIQETTVRRMSLQEKKCEFFGKQYQKMVLENIWNCYFNEEEKSLLQIDDRYVDKIYDTPEYLHKSDGKQYKKIQCSWIWDCYITESGEFLQIDGKNVVEIYQENWKDSDEKKNLIQMKLSDGQKITFEETTGKYVSTDLLKKIRENFEKLRRAQNVHDAFLVVLDMYENFQSYKCEEDLQQETLEKVYAIVRNLVEQGGNSKNKIQETLDSWQDSDDEDSDFFKKELANVKNIFKKKKDFKMILDAGVSIVDLYRKVGYEKDIEFPVALDCFSKENVAKIKSVSIHLDDDEEYCNKSFYKGYYEAFLTLPKNKLRITNLWIDNINVSNHFKIINALNYINIDANYKPSLEKLEKMIKKLEAKKLKKDMQTNLPDKQEKWKQQIQDIKSKIENFGEEEKEVFNSLLEIIENLQSQVNQLEDLTSKK